MLTELLLMAALSEYLPAALHPPPKPTPAGNNLVARLGDPKFAAREAAEQALWKEAEKHLGSITAGTNHPDPEVRSRTSKILRKYMDMGSLPGIWCLKNELRYPAGLKYERFKADDPMPPEQAYQNTAGWSICKPVESYDVARWYFQKALVIYRRRYEEDVSEQNFRHPEVSSLATELYLTELLCQGTPRTAVKKLAEEMAVLNRETNQLYQAESLTEWWNYSTYPPGPSIPLKDWKEPGYSFP